MSRPSRLIALALLCLPLIATATWLIAHGSAEPERDDRGGAVAATSTDVEDPQKLLLAAIERHKHQRGRRAALRSDTEGEPGLPRRDLASYAAVQAKAEPVARRFFAAYSLYEIDGLGRELAAELRATATERFAAQLLARPPLLPITAKQPVRAMLLGALELVPLAGEQPSARLRKAEFIGRVDRGGEETPTAITITLRRDGWRVSGIGR